MDSRQHTSLVLAVIVLVLVICAATCTRGSRAEHYGGPPGRRRGLGFRELGFRGWADMPGEYQGNTASAPSQYIMTSAGNGQILEGELIDKWAPGIVGAGTVGDRLNPGEAWITAGGDCAANRRSAQ